MIGPIVTFGLVTLYIYVRRKVDSMKRDNFTDRSWWGDVNYFALRYAIPPSVIAAIIQVESGGNPNAKGAANDIGLMQITPVVIAEYERETKIDVKNPFDPHVNLAIGIWYLARLRDYYGVGGIRSMLAAYNAGPTGAAKGLGIDYADKVLSLVPESDVV